MSIFTSAGSIVEGTVRTLREAGVIGLWFKSLSEIGCYRRAIMFRLPLDRRMPEVKPGLSVTVDMLDKNELDEYLIFRPKVDPSFIAERLSAGHHCFAARSEKRIVSAGWAAVDRAWSTLLDCEIKLSPDEVYVYDTFTKPDFRGRSVSPVIMAEIIRHFSAAGYRTMILVIEPENKSSIRAVRKVGFRPFGTMGYVRLGRWRRDFYREHKL